MVSDEWARQTKRWPTQSCHLPQKFTKVTTRKQHVPDSSAFAFYLIKLFSNSYPEENFGRQTQTQTQTNRHRHRHRTKRRQQDKIRDHEHRLHTCLSFPVSRRFERDHACSQKRPGCAPNLFMTFGEGWGGVGWGGGGRWEWVVCGCVCVWSGKGRRGTIGHLSGRVAFRQALGDGKGAGKPSSKFRRGCLTGNGGWWWWVCVVRWERGREGEREGRGRGWWWWRGGGGGGGVCVRGGRRGRGGEGRGGRGGHPSGRVAFRRALG